MSMLTVHAEQPKLVVGIIIDGLEQQTLDILTPYLDYGGFNRFLRDGVVLENVDYGTNVDATAATAILMTGAAPRQNGIGGELGYDASGRRHYNIFTDQTAIGVNTKDRLSPKALNVSTISDEARIAGAGETYVYAIAPKPAQALVLASHAGNNAIWFNEKTGQWASSKYYQDMPSAAANRNRTNSLKNRLDTMTWTPSRITKDKVPLPDHLKHYSFSYTFGPRETDRFARFAGSPMMNNEIAAIASEYVKNLKLGKHEGTDVLNLAFNLQPFEWSRNAENRFERYDSYIKLDKSLAQLFSTIDATVGRDNVLIYVAGTPARNERRKYDDKWNMPGGEFSSRKAVSLLNLYLIAKYGNGEWVSAYNNGSFYLNKDLANQLDKDINTIRRDASEFLVRMAGVGHAYTIEDVVNAEPKVPNSEGKSRNTVISQSGDVMIELIPGWTMIDDFNVAGATSNLTFSPAPTTSIFLISAPELQPARISDNVDARAIAPALTGMMHIRSPNSASTPAVSFK